MSDEVARPKGATARERAQRLCTKGPAQVARDAAGCWLCDAIEREILAAEREAVELFAEAHLYPILLAHGLKPNDAYFASKNAVEAWLRSREEE